MRTPYWVFFYCLCAVPCTSQTQAPTDVFTVTVTNAQKEVLEGAVVEVLRAGDKKLVKSAVTNKNGVSVFYIPLQVIYFEQQFCWA
jgi:uncharacterized membrane protein